MNTDNPEAKLHDIIRRRALTREKARVSQGRQRFSVLPYCTSSFSFLTDEEFRIQHWKCYLSPSLWMTPGECFDAACQKLASCIWNFACRLTKTLCNSEYAGR